MARIEHEIAKAARVESLSASIRLDDLRAVLSNLRFHLRREEAVALATAALGPFAGLSGPVSGLADGIKVRFDASFRLQNRNADCVTRPMVVTVGDIRRAGLAFAAMQNGGDA